MSKRIDRLRAGLALVTIVCLLPLPSMSAGRGPAATAAQDCADSMTAFAQLRGNVGMDAGIAGRANALTSAAESGNAVRPSDVEDLGDDSLESMDDAADQVEEIGETIGQALNRANLSRQGRAWGEGMKRMRNSRARFSTGYRPKRNRPPVKFSTAKPTLYDAAEQFEHAVGELKRIAIDGGFEAMGPSNMVFNVERDRMPTPNPRPNPWDEYLRRLYANEARIRAALNGLNAARALQQRQVQEAKRAAEEMNRAVEDARQATNAVERAVAPCASAEYARPTPQYTPPPPAAPPSSSAADAAVKKGGGGDAFLWGLIGLGIVGAGGAYLYQQYYACGAAPQSSSYSGCLSGNCNACKTYLYEISAYCDCVTARGQSAATCTDADYINSICAPKPRAAAR